MSRTQALLAFGAASLAVAALSWAASGAAARAQLLARRVAFMRQAAGAAPQATATRGGLLGPVARIGALLSRSGLLPASTLAELEHTLSSAGLRQEDGLALFVGAKLALTLILPAAAAALVHGSSLATATRALAICGAAAAGLLLPDFIVRRMRRRHLKAVAGGLPDALDMLVICSEAGLGLEAGLERVAVEIEPAHPAVAAELTLTTNELRILPDRRAALRNLGERTGIDTLRRLGATLIQTMQYGTPVSQALRQLAVELRFEMLMRFEAQAARLPVLLTLPMVLFILPCILIVVGGPAALTVMRSFATH